MKMNFWPYQVKVKVKRLGLDGDYWTLEGTKNGEVKQIEEWSPEVGNYRALSLPLWRASGLFMGHYDKIEE